MNSKYLLVTTLIVGASVTYANFSRAQAITASSTNSGSTNSPSAQAAPGDNASSDALQEIVVTGKFISKGSTSAMKLDVPVRDIPFSVSNYTGDFLKSIETDNVADLYRYMTGIQRAGNTGYDLTIRGFKTQSTDRNSILVDGLPGLTVRFGSPPTIGTDHVELVKGPASLLYGQAQPGGFVNIITKKPEAEQSSTFTLRGTEGAGSIGDVSGFDLGADITGPIDPDGKLLYRLIAEYGYDNTFRTRAYQRPLYFAPGITWHIDDDTTATVQVEYRSTRTGYDTYLVAPGNNYAAIPAFNTHYQTPNDYLKEVGGTVSTYIKHEFNDSLTWNTSFRGVDHRDNARGFDVNAILPDLTEISVRARGQLNVRTYLFGDSNIVAKFDTGPINNKLIFGAELGRETLNADREQFYNIPTTPSTVAGPHKGAISIYSPDFSALLPLSSYPLVLASAPTGLSDRYSTSLAEGVYVSDLLSFGENWKAQFGLRFSQEKNEQKELRLPGVATTGDSNNAVLPLGALLYEPTKSLTFYASYATSFVPAPATAQDIFGRDSFNPTTAQSIEVGSKAELIDGRLNVTAALFSIDKQNVLDTFTGGLCPASIGTCTQQVGAERSQGAELELTATPIDGLQIIAGYAHTIGKVVKSNIPQQVGAELTNVPADSAHIWARYDFSEGRLAGLGVGAGVTYTSNRVGLLPTATVSQTLPLPSYTVADMAIYYQLENYEVTFKVNNLLDERYIESVGFSGNINVLPGAPRSVELALRAKF